MFRYVKWVGEKLPLPLNPFTTLQLKTFYITVLHVPWFEAARLIKSLGSFVVVRMSN